MDLVCPVRVSLYRGPHLILAVEKIIIDQKSLGLLLNRMLPGSYQSVSKIDFKALDQVQCFQVMPC